MAKKESKIVTIFGGTGFLGRNIVKILAENGYNLRIPTRNMEKAILLKPAGNVAQIVPFLCNIGNETAVSQAIAGSDSVINLIGTMQETGRSGFQAIHLETAARLARIAKAHGASNFVHISALGANKQAASHYARSKAAGEEALRLFFPDAVVLRPSLIFGPDDNFFNRFARMARFSPILPLIGGGLTRFQPVYVGDVASAVVAALTNPQAKGKTYELAGPRVYTFRQLLELVLQHSGHKRILLDMPFWLAQFLAVATSFLPEPPLRQDQIVSLQSDNVITDTKGPGLVNLGIMPTVLEPVVATFLGATRPM